MYSRYFELLKESLSMYVNLTGSGLNQAIIGATIANSNVMAELYVL